MADDNKPFKYIRYAIGEIVLVVIGILIALQINNWNENRIISNTEQIILKDLKVEISANIKVLENVILKNRRALNDAQNLLKFYENPEKLADVSERYLFEMTWNLPGTIFQSEAGILNSIIYSGQINMIKNRKLKYKLASFNNLTERKTAYSKSVRKLGNEYFDKIIYPKVSRIIQEGKNINTSFKEAYKIPEFHLVIRGTYSDRRRESIKMEEELKTFYEEVLTLINSEINNK